MQGEKPSPASGRECYSTDSTSTKYQYDSAPLSGAEATGPIRSEACAVGVSSCQFYGPSQKLMAGETTNLC